MLAAWAWKSGVNGAHELLTPETLCCQALHRNNGMTDGQKLLESEKMDCRGAGLAQTTSLVPLASMTSMTSMATVVPVASTALMGPS